MLGQIFALPTLLFINDGKVLKRIEGANGKKMEFPFGRSFIYLRNRSSDGEKIAISLRVHVLWRPDARRQRCQELIERR